MLESLFPTKLFYFDYQIKPLTSNTTEFIFIEVYFFWENQVPSKKVKFSLFLLYEMSLILAPKPASIQRFLQLAQTHYFRTFF